MNQAVTLGPLVLPAGFLLLVATMAGALLVNRWRVRRGGLDAEPHIHTGLLLGLLAARLAFVWQYRAAYAAAPLGVLDIRDGGWDAQAGFLAAWAYGLTRMAARAEWRRALLSALGVASGLWIGGSLLLLASAAPPAPLPAFSLQSAQGGSVSLAAFRGKPTVVNLWATWCPPCRAEMPVLQAAQARRPDLNFVFLNQGERLGTVAEFLARMRLPLDHVLLDPDLQAGRHFDGLALPTTLFFDASGQLVARHLGLLSAASLERYLEQIAAAPPR